MKRKSKSERKVFVKTPSGRNTISLRDRRPSKRTCKTCGAVLKGVKRISAFKLSKTSKSKKRANRKFGGELCSKCSRSRLIDKARGFLKK